MTTFKGWISRGYLPHFDTPDVIQSVTFRLADSLPADVMDRIRSTTPDRDRPKQVEAYLDSGHGSCLLDRPDIADMVERALLHFDGDRYRLLAWSIMPIYRLVGGIGSVWQPDYFDRFIRDQCHLDVSIHYVEHNPVTAGLCREAS